ncbi:MAG: (2Fe-2S) ferredoxin domain-containing protein [Candidatus Omnitrophica bacterium]|nr:(2Fe-2S) ferredoxin domain-containing protein [Candidatus Omnitrophota bacterium]
MKKRKIYIDTGGLTCPKKRSQEFLRALLDALRKAGLEQAVQVIPRGCFGLCNLAPNLYIEPDGLWYSRFTVKDIPEIVQSHLIGGQPVTRLIHYKKG